MYNELAVDLIKKQKENIIVLLENVKTNRQTLVSELMSYITVHFDDEEKFARGARYPKLEMLINEHLFYTKRLNEIINTTADSNQFKQLIDNWMSMYSSTSDRNLINFLSNSAAK